MLKHHTTERSRWNIQPQWVPKRGSTKAFPRSRGDIPVRICTVDDFKKIQMRFQISEINQDIKQDVNQDIGGVPQLWGDPKNDGL